jgi:predicted permease
MDALLTDLRHAVRLFRRTPGWTATAILSLALGIGANLLIFSIVDAVLLRPFPYRDPSRLVFVWGTKNDAVRRGISGADLADWQARNRSFDSLDAFLGQMPFTLGDSGETVQGACIGPSVLPLLGVAPALGRNFLPSEARLGADNVAIVTDGFWRGRMSGATSALGAALRLSGKTYEVVGIMPPGFFFPDTDAQILVSTPCGAANFSERGTSYAHAVGRLRAGVTVQQAQADLDRINADLARTYPDTNKNVTAGVQPLRNIVVGRYEQSLWLMLAAVGVVLLIACANVAHLQLARGLDRKTELAVRAAAGAGRLRLFRQLLTETVVLAAIGGALATVCAWWGIRVIRSLGLTDIARLDAARLDWRVAAIAAALSLASTMLAGVWPAWKGAGVVINEVLKTGGGATGTPRGARLRELLATSELALATMLLIVAGLLIGSFVRLSRAQWGFNPDGLWLANVMLPADASGSFDAGHAWIEQVRSRLGAIGGVQSAANAEGVPIDYVWRPRRLLDPANNRPFDWAAAGWIVSHGYFRTIGTAIRDGREFDEGDTSSSAPVTIVSRALAERLWPHQRAVGREIRVLQLRTVNGKLAPDVEARIQRRDPTLEFDLSAYDTTPRRIIGVVEDIRAFGLDVKGNTRAFYIDYRQDQEGRPFRATKFVIRATGDGAQIASTVRSIVARDSRGELRNFRSMSEMVAHSIGGHGSNRLMMLVSALFGALALALTATGIFGTMLHTVNQRLPEMGVRVALGASRARIAWLVFGYGLRVLTAGAALGLTLTWAVSRSLRALLFEVTGTDAFTYAAGVAVIAVAVVVACLVPARRAVRFDPSRLLRS